MIISNSFYKVHKNQISCKNILKQHPAPACPDFTLFPFCSLCPPYGTIADRGRNFLNKKKGDKGLTGEDGTFNLQKIAILRGSVRGAVLSGGLLAFLLLLPQAVTAAPGPAGGPGKGLTAGQAGSARQGARVQASREVEAGSNPAFQSGDIRTPRHVPLPLRPGPFRRPGLVPPHRPPGSLPGQNDHADVPHAALPGLPYG